MHMKCCLESAAAGGSSSQVSTLSSVRTQALHAKHHAQCVPSQGGAAARPAHLVLAERSVQAPPPWARRRPRPAAAPTFEARARARASRTSCARWRCAACRAARDHEPHRTAPSAGLRVPAACTRAAAGAAAAAAAAGAAGGGGGAAAGTGAAAADGDGCR
eukprot:5069830-Pleurochrysis_carterae.AAC.2